MLKPAELQVQLGAHLQDLDLELDLSALRQFSDYQTGERVAVQLGVLLEDLEKQLGGQRCHQWVPASYQLEDEVQMQQREAGWAEVVDVGEHDDELGKL